MRAFQRARRGRPPKAANDNEPDRGTAELQAKRAALAQGVAAEATENPLDLLLAHGFIDAAQHRAGWRYGSLYRRLIGHGQVSYGRLYQGLTGQNGRALAARAEPDDLAAEQALFRAAQAGLRAEGAYIAAITERLAVFNAFPDWLLARDARGQRERAALVTGLKRLADAFRRNRGDAR